MRRSSIASALAAAALMALAACGGGSSSPSASDVGVTKDQILIGATVPLSGPAAAYGTIAKASEAYFNYVNAHGGVNGRKIKYDYLDDGYDPSKTVPLTKQLVEQDKVFLTFGGLGTQCQTSVREYLNAKKVPQVFVATGATTFSAEYSKWPYTWGWQPVYQGEALIYAKYVLQNMPNAKIGVIYQNDDYGQDYLNGLEKGLAGHTNLIVDKESNDVGAPSLTSQILKLKSSGADTFFIFETPKPAIISLVTADKVNWHPTTFLNSVAGPIPYVKLAEQSAGDPAAVNGIVSVNYLKDPVSPTFASDSGMQLYKQVMSQYYSSGKVEDAFNVYGMASAFSLVDVLKRAGTNLTRSAVQDALAHLDETDNPFLLPGVSVSNTPSDHYTISKEEIIKYDAASGDYQPVGNLISVAGEIKFP